MQLKKILEDMEQYRRRAVENGDFNVAAAHEKDMNIISKHMNDGWISVEERLPEEKKSVLVQWEKYDRSIDETLIYLDVMWLEDEEDVVFETINGIPNGRVIAWCPLPEPYRPERSDGK